MVKLEDLVEKESRKRRDFGKDPVAYYEEHYSGLARGQLHKEDRSLYNRLWKDGLLENVPLKKK